MTAGESRPWLALLFGVFTACGGTSISDAEHTTTAGSIAIANLDAQIAQHGDQDGIEDLLLARSRFLGDYDALSRAVALAEGRSQTGADLVRRARTRSAAHRFQDALADLSAAQEAGARAEEIASLRASILVATGRAGEAIPQLEAAVASRPGYASRSALAGSYAAVGRFAEAERLYLEALSDLQTTSPFPFAWIHFARGLMWTEQAHDSARGEAQYARALAYLPEFVVANVHMAELEAARGELAPAITRLERVQSSDDPEVIALLGSLLVRTGDEPRGWRLINRARGRYELLLAQHPLAFADHAAEFYLGPGSDPERAWVLAQLNLANRRTDRALALAAKAASARAGHQPPSFTPIMTGTNSSWSRFR